ncbi:ribonuclease H-like protein, partial [Auricularia subglabra TFB-10046 SS5]
MIKLFGYSTVSSAVVEVYTDGSCLNNGRPNAACGSGVYWGERNTLNCAARAPGPGQTNNRGELYAIFIALRDAALDKTLRVTSDSEYAINSATWNAPRAAANGWQVPNGDIIMLIVSRIQQRQAQVRFSYTKSHAQCTPNEEADHLAKVGAGLS